MPKQHETRQTKDGRTATYIDGDWYVPAAKTVVSQQKVSRDSSKGSNYSCLYGGGVKATMSPWVTAFPNLDRKVLFKKTKHALKLKKGVKDDQGYYRGGSDSGAFNYMEDIALRSPLPTLPCLGTKISTALRPSVVGLDFVTGRVNWTIQCSGSEFLAMFLTCIHWLGRRFDIPFQFMISIHDEIWFMCPTEYKEIFAVMLQICHLMTWSRFQAGVGINDIPVARAYASSISVDFCVRKSPFETTTTLSQPIQEPHGDDVTIDHMAERGWIDLAESQLAFAEM